MNSKTKINLILGLVRRLSGQKELPMRTDFELTRTLSILFSKTGKEGEQ